MWCLKPFRVLKKSYIYFLWLLDMCILKQALVLQQGFNGKRSCASLVNLKTWKPCHMCHRHERHQLYGWLQCDLALTLKVFAFHKCCIWPLILDYWWFYHQLLSSLTWSAGLVHEAQRWLNHLWQQLLFQVRLEHCIQYLNEAVFVLSFPFLLEFLWSSVLLQMWVYLLERTRHFQWALSI